MHEHTEDSTTDGRKLAREIIGLFLIFWALLLLLSLVTFNMNDPSLNHVVSGNVVVSNKAGLFGAYLAGFLNDILGIAAYICPFIFAAIGAAYVSTLYELLWWRWLGYFFMTLFVLNAGAAWDIQLGDMRGGGMVGRALYENTRYYFSPSGQGLFWGFLLLVATQLAFDISWLNGGKRVWEFVRRSIPEQALPRISLPRLNLSHLNWSRLALSRLALLKLPRLAWLREKIMDRPTTTEALPASMVEALPSAEDIVVRAVDTYEDTLSMGMDVYIPEEQPDKAPPAPAFRQEKRDISKIPFPSLELLTEEKKDAPKSKPENLEARGKTLIACLADFDVQGELVRITPGPVVTMYEVRPAAGVRVSRIANLNDDLALALKALAVRIQAPILGTDTVGIEIPNDVRESVNFRTLLESDVFRNNPGKLNMVLGRDIAGRPYVSDLSRMPHLLVAGATGAGKSVCLNTILMSFLYTVHPDEVKLLLIDPKRIEMTAYIDLPHLVHPVVTEMSQAKTALDWAVHEMDQRYAAMAKIKARNIESYNQKIASFGKNLPPDYADLTTFPYLVLIIDELADLMLTAAREVENSIIRLAQLARAAGIHMILATQRPSVDVVTGLIKANFPSRISFQVSSKHDSRTILDTVGAEHLLGKGDMLFKPNGGRIMRLHGPFVSDEDVQAVVGYWKRQIPPDYKVDFVEWNNEAAQAGGGGGGGDASQDPLYAEVQDFVHEQGKASISYVQRRFKIGFNRAARLVEQLERDGIIGPADGSKPRAVVNK